MSDVKELAKIERKVEGGSAVEYDTETGKVRLSPEIIKKYLISGDPTKVTDAEVLMFLKLCQYQKLNPFLREAYLIKYGDEPATIVVGKETFTKRAAKCELCAGWQAGVIVRKYNRVNETKRKLIEKIKTVAASEDEKKLLMDFVNYVVELIKTSEYELEYRVGTLVQPDEELIGGWAKVYRKDWTVPIEISVSLQEYIRKKKDGQPTRSWREMPATMIRKVALVQALREAFPEQFQGMYAPEEMPVDSAQLPTEPVTVENYQQEPSTLPAAETVSMSYTQQTSKEEKVVPLPAKETRTEEIQQTSQFELHNVAIISDPVIQQSKKGTDYMKAKVIADEGEFELIINQKEIMEQVEKGFIFGRVTIKKLSSGLLLVTSVGE
ncbi:phage recombination protein Bet [Caldicellulosiruptor acetigenus I77R1B]|uniref:Phage recombination protein Bet n=1 Tax=Caldicellulosiruptor acetigenus (strain ATCC 700853 / DSM 12137 / I77R1B) TaxID=632335 RepID=E4S5A7_CALA7|nr:phage recombination protein Bet [Caldicellulosiruptor acetigenus]ADQ41541.1 phage recombination protein Bet [Caldicellulosiruptor acetigenus I77R1B]